jgi:hypothetical protein
MQPSRPQFWVSYLHMHTGRNGYFGSNDGLSGTAAESNGIALDAGTSVGETLVSGKAVQLQVDIHIYFRATGCIIRKSANGTACDNLGRLSFQSRG